VQREVAAVVVIGAQVRAAAMQLRAMLLRQEMPRRVILLLRQMVPLPQVVEVLEVERAEEVAEAAADAVGVARLPNLLFLKPLKRH
jgi:hypothetical protein